jgi:hypothetical protein
MTLFGCANDSRRIIGTWSMDIADILETEAYEITMTFYSDNTFSQTIIEEGWGEFTTTGTFVIEGNNLKMVDEYSIEDNFQFRFINRNTLVLTHPYFMELIFTRQ